MKRSLPTSTIKADTVLSYWLGDASTNPDKAREKKRLWYPSQKNQSQQTTDLAITDRFGVLFKDASAERLNLWRQHPRSTLALVIVLDQFSRHIHRGTPRAFQQDPLALEISAELTDHQGLSLLDRAFLYHPYKHVESLGAQAASVQLFKGLLSEADESWQPMMSSFYRSACQHQDIIKAYGRFPHRNEILDRENTQAEQKFLASNGSTFGQRKRDD